MTRWMRTVAAGCLALGVVMPAACSTADPGDSCTDAVVFEAESTAINVMFLLDRSGSMHLPVKDDTTRWTATKFALFNMFDALEERAHGAVSMFPAGDAPLTCCTVDNPNCGQCTDDDIPAPTMRCDAASYTGTTLDLMTPDRIDAMKSVVSASDEDNYWGTPMAAALAGAVDSIDQQQGPWDNVIVLLTDGNPTACDSTDDPEANDIELVLSEAERGMKAGIRTYVVGVVDENQGADEEHMSRLAIAGGTARYEGCVDDVDCAYEVHPETFEADVAAALEQIVRDTTSCTFETNGVTLDDAPTVSIASGDEIISVTQDLTDGWELLPGGTIQLHGESCEKLKSLGNATLQVSSPCSGT